MDAGLGDAHFATDYPLTVERVRMACADAITALAAGGEAAAASFRAGGSY